MKSLFLLFLAKETYTIVGGIVMNTLFEKLLEIVIKENASDVHLTLKKEKLEISLRCTNGIIKLKQSFSIMLFHYLKFISNLDLGNMNVPQSGNFTYTYKRKTYFFRLSFIQTLDVQSAVLRILNNHQNIAVSQLSKDKKQNEIFQRWCRFRGGLSIFSGPTGSGKTTTLHSLLETIAQNQQLKVITLEDPIEIRSDSYLQLQINEKMNLGYEEGIKQLLRHDPDVIMIGEVRDANTAKTLITCALSGHMVFTTLHAKTAKEAIMRLLDFGVKKSDLQQVLSNVTNQRIFPSLNRKGRVCIYEIMERQHIQAYLQSQPLENYFDIYDKIKEAVDKKYISKQLAQQDVDF